MVEIDLDQGLTVWGQQMDGAADAGVETVDRPQHFRRSFDTA